MSAEGIVTESSFYYNIGGEGGGIGATGKLTVKDSTFVGNKAFRMSGTFNPAGGAIGSKALKATITGSTFLDNFTAGEGGAIDTYLGDFTVTNCTFHGNTASKGGALFNPIKSVLTVKNSTLSGNRVTKIEEDPEGAGIYHQSGTKEDEAGTLTLINTIVSDNTGAANCAEEDPVNHPITDGGGNLRWPRDDDSCPGKKGDPLLSALGSYGGNTETFGLLPGSEAINAGNAEVCARRDQRDVMRPRGHCDAGAFESRGFIGLVLSGDDQSAFTGEPFAKPLGVYVFSPWDEPTQGGRVTFTSPREGAATDPRTKTSVISKGVAKVKVTANAKKGSYTVEGGGKGILSPAKFHLTNKK